MADFVEARVTHTFKASAERVFDAWLDPDMVRRWMGAALKGFGLSGDMRRVEIDGRVGGRFTFSDMREAGEAVHWGTYLEIDRPRELVFQWFTSAQEEKESSSVVAVRIEPAGTGCVVTLIHRVDARYAANVRQTETGWAAMLDQIDAVRSAPGAQSSFSGSADPGKLRTG